MADQSGPAEETPRPTARETARKSVEAARKWRSSLFDPNSKTYFVLGREGSTFLFAFFLAAWQLIDWEPQGPVGVYVMWFIGSGLLVWVNAAQRNAVVISADEDRPRDDKQVQRDTGWSSLPNYIIYLMVILTVVGLCLEWFTPVFENPESHWIRDRMIISWPYAGFLLQAAIVLRGDQMQNIRLVTIIQQLIQRYRRQEH